MSAGGTGESLLLEATLEVKNELLLPSGGPSPEPSPGTGDVNGTLEVSTPAGHPQNGSPIMDTPLFTCKNKTFQSQIMVLRVRAPDLGLVAQVQSLGPT